MQYNPLMEAFTPTTGIGWPDVIDDIAKRIERAIRRGDTNGAFKAVSVLDLIDGETAAWFREYGFDLLNGSKENESQQVTAENIEAVLSDEQAGLRIPLLSIEAGTDSDRSVTEISII